MSLLLNALLGGSTHAEALAASTKKISEIGARKNHYCFRVTHRNGFISTDIYPEVPPWQVLHEPLSK